MDSGCQGLEERRMRVTNTGHRVSLVGNENVQDLDSGDALHNSNSLNYKLYINFVYKLYLG